MSEKKKRNGCLKAVAAITFVVIVLAFLITGGCYLKNWIGVKSTEGKVVQLLNEKYNDNFAIAKGEYVWSTNTYRYLAYPVNEPNFKFMVLISPMTQSGISTTYLLTRRFYDITKQVKPYVNSLTTENFFYINSGTSVDKKMQDTILKDIDENLIVSNDVLLEKYPYLLDTHCGITYCYEVTDQSREQIAKDVYKLLLFLREKKFGVIEISISFYGSNLFEDSNFKKEAKQSPGQPSFYNYRVNGHKAIYAAQYLLSIFEKYDSKIGTYLPSHYGDKGIFTDTDRIISDYKDIENQIVKFKSINRE
ncbi:MAG TPA: hypothetical protein DD381_06805 [Lentisphaeria bacterium]|nr:hypothetical protein [Lentisphaeria bacterium]